MAVMRYFPTFLDMRGRIVLMAGAGEVAAAKLRLLMKTEADIRVYGERVASEIAAWAEERRLRLIPRPISHADFAGADLLYIADDGTDDEAAAKRLAEAGRAAGLLVNVVDQRALCDFITPAIVDRAPLVVAIGSEGEAPMLARQVKAKLEAMLPSALGPLAELAGNLRGAARAVPAGAARRGLWARFFGGVGERAWRAGGEAAARGAFQALVAESAAIAGQPNGNVALVGAGPGDPELLTIKAHRLLADADIVIYDRLVSEAVLELARREAHFICVGKAPGEPGWTQEAINALLVEKAASGQRIVRLKSGDPGVYGRLDEEVAALDAAGIACEVVPGITAAAAGAAELGLSLTRRARNSSFRLLTGHDTRGFAEHDWQALAKPGANAAIYMGVRAARFIEGRLIMHGAAPQMPVTVVENISRPERRELATTLGGLSAAMAAAGITGPAILYLGLAPRGAAHDAGELAAATAAGPAQVPVSAPATNEGVRAHG